MNCLGIGIFAVAVFALLLLFLPLKIENKQIKKLLILAMVLALFVISFNLFYYHIMFEKVNKFSETEFSGDAVILDCDEDSALVYTDKGFLCEVYFEEFEIQEPTTKIHFTGEINNIADNKYKGRAVYASAYAKEYEIISEEKVDSLIYSYYIFRKSLKENLDFGDDELNSFARSVTLGDTDELSAKFLHKFRNVGMSHVMSVSGMHLMFAVNFLNILLAAFNISYKRKAIISILAAFLFTFVSGFAVSCIRAFIMLLIMNIGLMIDKESDSLTSLVISAFVILLFTPYNYFNVSFILSVFATFGLIVVGPLLSAFVKISCKNYFLNATLNTVKNSLMSSLGANIACIPVFLAIFKQINIISPIINVILTIPVQIIFYIGFIALLLSPMQFLTDLLKYIYKPLYSLIVYIVDFFFDLKYTTVTDGNKYFYLIFVLLLVLVFGIFIFKIFKSKIRIFYYIAGYAFMCIAIFLFSLFTAKDKVLVKIVDVGQGGCNLITKGEKAVIIDSGGQSMTELNNQLRHSNVKRIELLAVTHADKDHIGFVENLLNSYEVEAFIYPEFCEQALDKVLESVDKENTKVIPLSKDTQMTILDGCDLDVFVEKAYETKMSSNVGALYKFTYSDTSVCFTGDMTINQEYVFLDYGTQLDCDILVVPHHGSATSSYNKILDLYSPEYSVISVGEYSLYKLPDKRTISKLEDRSIVKTTLKESTVIFELDKEGYRVLEK